MNLSFGQKLLVAFGILLLLVMGAFTLSGNLRLQETTDTYVDALIEDTVAQSTSSIADWLNTRLAMTEATAKALESVETDAEARVILAAATTGGGFIDVYVGRDDGYMLMKDDASEATLPADFDPRTRPWFKQAKQKGSASFTEPYVDAGTGGTIISTLAPVKRGAYQGVVGGDIALKTIEQTLSTITLANTGYAALISDDGTVLFHPDQKLVGKKISSLLGESPRLSGEIHEYDTGDASWTAGFHRIKGARGVEWYLGTFINEDKINAPVHAARVTGLIIAVIGLLVSLVILRFGIRVLMAPVRKLNAAMASIASGEADLTKRLDDSANDEFGKLAAEFNSFVENIQNVVRDVQQGTAELAKTCPPCGILPAPAETALKNSRPRLIWWPRPSMRCLPLPGKLHRMPNRPRMRPTPPMQTAALPLKPLPLPGMQSRNCQKRLTPLRKSSINSARTLPTLPRFSR